MSELAKIIIQQFAKSIADLITADGDAAREAAAIEAAMVAAEVAKAEADKRKFAREGP